MPPPRPSGDVAEQEVVLVASWMALAGWRGNTPGPHRGYAAFIVP